MLNKGLLLVVSDTPGYFEEEFNAWYDTDHIPERMAIPGFETGRRYVSADRARRYLALYDLTTVGVLETPDYLKFSGVNFTPWSKRVVSRCRIDRVAATQVSPGRQLVASASRLLLVRVAGATAETAAAYSRQCFQGQPGVAQVRAFSEDEAGRMHLVVVGDGDLAGLIRPAETAGNGLSLTSAETYLPY